MVDIISAWYKIASLMWCVESVTDITLISEALLVLCYGMLMFVWPKYKQLNYGLL